MIDKPTTQLYPRVFTVTQISTVREKKNDGKRKTKNHQPSKQPRTHEVHRQLCVFAETLLVFDAPRTNQKIAIVVSVVLLLLTPMAGSQKGAGGLVVRELQPRQIRFYGSFSDTFINTFENT